MAGRIINSEKGVSTRFDTEIFTNSKLNFSGYLLPNDEQEADRLDIHNELILSAMHRKLHLAPLPQDIQSAIDLGTGTGVITDVAMPD